FYRYKFLLFVNEILFWEKKRHSKAYKDCAWHISSFIVDASFLNRNDLKHENPTGYQAALNC
ncbi:hypothetical protein, partial [Acinetobacter baumannii]|uniref:hypothetical protein n=2 Tax=Acinetobacter baumannii TaxID=470 RepID=UPI00385A6B49